MLQISSVTDMTALIKAKLEKDIPPMLIKAEISECKFHYSGHIYLTLKDSGAVCPAVIWKSTAAQLNTRPAVGMEVLVFGQLSVYAPHGKYQFIIQSLQDAGRGELFLQYEALKTKLIDEGLTDPERKKPIPAYPLHVGLVTSETGAALQDMLRVFAQDAAHVKLTLSPARVQGKNAAGTVIEALDALKTVQPDLVLCARGGGSIEDLWEFNDESLARYIAKYPIPVISGIGHETDTTIIDLVSDHRASTPTNAAEFVCASWREVKIALNQIDYTLSNSMQRAFLKQKERLENYQRYLSSRRVSDNLKNLKEKLDGLITNASQAILKHIQLKQVRFDGMKGKLIAYAPQNVLKKGYVLIKDRNDKLLRSVETLSEGQAINIHFHDGSAEADVKTINKGKTHE
jgi:exodeoxyribonuclease VII large subunit